MKKKTCFKNGLEVHEDTGRPVWIHRPRFTSKAITGDETPFRDSSMVNGILDSLQQLEESTRPGAKMSKAGKDLAAFKALSSVALLVEHVAGWALDHQRGLAMKGLKFVPLVPSQTKQSPDYLSAREAVDIDSHEKQGSLREALTPAQTRRYVFNLLQAMEYHLGIPHSMTEALEALDYGEVLPVLERTPTTRRTGLTVYRAKLSAIAFIEYQYKKGIKKLQSTEEVADAFASTRDAIKDWPVELRKELGNLEVERTLAAARNAGVQYLIERKHDVDGFCPYADDRHGRPAMIRASALYRARSKRVVSKGK